MAYTTVDDVKSLFNDSNNQQPSALVSLSAYTMSQQDSQAMASALSKTPFPVLLVDVVPGFDSGLPRERLA